MSFFEENKSYVVRVVDLHSPDAKTFSVSVNDLTGRYPTNEEIQMPGVLINALLDSAIPHEITKIDHGFPRIVGYKYRPRFSVTPVGLGTFPTADATIITSGISDGEVAPSDDGAKMFNALEGAEPMAATDDRADREQELASKIKAELIEIASGYGLDYSDRNNKSEIITGIIAAEAAE